jgi:DNA polymerase-4
VLAPELRDPVSALAVLYRLLHKAAMRLRHYDACAGGLSLHLGYLKTDSRHAHWVDQARFSPHADTFAFNPLLAELWRRRPPDPAPLLKVGVTLFDLVDSGRVTRNLFDPDDRHAAINRVLDRINLRYGPNTLYFGGAHQGRGAAPMRIAFGHIPELRVENDG